MSIALAYAVFVFDSWPLGSYQQLPGYFPDMVICEQVQKQVRTARNQRTQCVQVVVPPATQGGHP